MDSSIETGGRAWCFPAQAIRGEGWIPNPTTPPPAPGTVVTVATVAGGNVVVEQVPRPGTTSMMSWVGCQYLYWALPI